MVRLKVINDIKVLKATNDLKDLKYNQPSIHAGRTQYSKVLPPRNSRRSEVGGRPCVEMGLR